MNSSQCYNNDQLVSYTVTYDLGYFWLLIMSLFAHNALPPLLFIMDESSNISTYFCLFYQDAACGQSNTVLDKMKMNGYHCIDLEHANLKNYTLSYGHYRKVNH